MTVVSQIIDNGWSFIITAKPERNKELFSWYDYLPDKKQAWQYIDKEGHQHHFEWSNNLPLKQEHKAENRLHVNLLEYTEIDPSGAALYYNSWITNLNLHHGNVKEIAKGGATRFTIENVTFNEQKTRGFHTTHNFGHFGNLPNVFFRLAQIAHLFSQVHTLWKEGKKQIKAVGSCRRFWERAAVIFSSIVSNDYSDPILYVKLEINSS